MIYNVFGGTLSLTQPTWKSLDFENCEEHVKNLTKSQGIVDEIVLSGTSVCCWLYIWSCAGV